MTDAYQTGMYHVAYASTTLTSPNGRTASSGLWHAVTSVRVDVYLGWDANDLGNYLVSTFHAFYCYAAMRMIYLSGSSGSVTAPLVVLTLRNTFGESVSLDNEGADGYEQWNGTTALGTFKNFNDGYWQTGVELVGRVYPTTYAGSITLKRQIINYYDYFNSTTATDVWPPCPPDHPNCDDTSPYFFRDDDPQSGGAAGRVYDTDIPGIPPLSTNGTYRRLRVNFREYAMADLPNRGPTQVSADFRWWSRLSVWRPNGETILKTDVPGDNVSGILSTPITWDLQP